MAEIIITVSNFEDEVLRSDIPVLVDFWASWCAPCRMLAPTIAALAEDHAGTLKVGKVNVDEQPELAMRFGVSGIPTVILFRDGAAAGKSVGFVPRETLEALL